MALVQQQAPRGFPQLDGVSPLLLVDGTVPFPPGFGWGKHTSASTHVTERTLTGSVSTTTTNTRNTSNSTTGTPRLGRGLVTGMFVNSVWLSGVLCHVGVHKVNNIGSDGSLEHGRQCNLRSSCSFLIEYGHQRSCNCHSLSVV